MGRVRRYKKYKACDPYAKKQKSEIDLVHDQPPEIHEQKGNSASCLLNVSIL
jgi:hypothetical protein